MTTIPDVEALPHDAMTRMLTDVIVNGIQQLDEGNEVLLADDSGTPVRDVDKALKDYVPEYDSEGKQTNKDDLSEKDQELVKAATKAAKAYKAYRDAQEAARNLYRTNVLGEEAKEEPDVDKDALYQARKVVTDSADLLETYATANKKPEIVAWLKSLEIPQVGRKGTSAVGQKKPRAFVSVDGVVHDSFGEAAKALSAALSTDENKVTVTAGDLISVWVEANEPAEFTYQGHALTVKEKPKKSDEKKAA